MSRFLQLRLLPFAISNYCFLFDAVSLADSLPDIDDNNDDDEKWKKSMWKIRVFCSMCNWNEKDLLKKCFIIRTLFIVFLFEFGIFRLRHCCPSADRMWNDFAIRLQFKPSFYLILFISLLVVVVSHFTHCRRHHFFLVCFHIIVFFFYFMKRTFTVVSLF